MLIKALNMHFITGADMPRKFLKEMQVSCAVEKSLKKGG